MIRILKQKISPILAFLFVVVFGFFSIFLMDKVFQKYADDELLTRVNQLEQLLQEQSLIPLTPEQIIQSVLSPAEQALHPQITIIMATDDYIKANLFYNPGGNYILAAKADGEWKNILEGNGIPNCLEIAGYDFPKDMVPNCID